MPARNIKRDLWNEEALKAERTRLIRYCFRLTGNRDAAEDLAQETLLEAWKHADRLRDSAVWTSFVYGVARNVCLRWQRREFPRLRHHSAVAFSEENETLFTHSHAITPDTALENLENEEMTALLDAALATLPAKDRELLIERHIMEFPIPEMAARRRMTENALRVRTHRARQNLARTLLSPALRETAQSYGLVASDSADGWQETRIWCPRCGQRRLEARLQDNKIRENSFRSPYFAVRCGDCAENLGLDFTSGHPRLPVNTTLALVRGHKPLLNRLAGWWSRYFEDGIRRDAAPCVHCGHPQRFTPIPPSGIAPRLARIRGVYFVCDRCSRATCVSASGLAYHHPAVQQFWRTNPRMALTPERDVVFGGCNAVAVRLESQVNAAAIEVTFSRTDFAVLNVEK